ncbi:hypothetical protein BDK51DRAFT_30872 [Blyttiomyces helicus]|uniref:Uncharacterized protein n=1 Tax=Blyttiomyces helicus TaxID=388810 RepID=A0A4P9WJM7_9FUNG|nr:hypothetical protein BDK51DRAFT_30872 [Blyttiomyces helicus]|eukprot:RKO90846.1 hypothetical protein BDK51DRAFT_30872 [Blyttiomyces helicus]
MAFRGASLLVQAGLYTCEQLPAHGRLFQFKNGGRGVELSALPLGLPEWSAGEEVIETRCRACKKFVKWSGDGRAGGGTRMSGLCLQPASVSDENVRLGDGVSRFHIHAEKLREVEGDGVGPVSVEEAEVGVKGRDRAMGEEGPGAGGRAVGVSIGSVGIFAPEVGLLKQTEWGLGSGTGVRVGGREVLGGGDRGVGVTIVQFGQLLLERLLRENAFFAITSQCTMQPRNHGIGNENFLWFRSVSRSDMESRAAPTRPMDFTKSPTETWGLPNASQTRQGQHIWPLECKDKELQLNEAMRGCILILVGNPDNQSSCRGWLWSSHQCLLNVVELLLLNVFALQTSASADSWEDDAMHSGMNTWTRTRKPSRMSEPRLERLKREFEAFSMIVCVREKAARNTGRLRCAFS